MPKKLGSPKRVHKKSQGKKMLKSPKRVPVKKRKLGSPKRVPKKSK